MCDVHVYVWYPCVCMCGNQKLKSYVFRYTLSLNLELTHFSYANWPGSSQDLPVSIPKC